MSTTVIAEMLIRCLAIAYVSHTVIVLVSGVPLVNVESRVLRYFPSLTENTGVRKSASDLHHTSGTVRLRHYDIAAFRKQQESTITDDDSDDDVRKYDAILSASNMTSMKNESRIHGNVSTRFPVAESSGGDDDDGDDAATARRRLPNVIVIGAKKSGTRALLEFLKIHEDVRAAGPEIHFFDRYYDRGLEWYRSQMPATIVGQLTIEKTPSYLVTGRVVERIYAMNPSVRLLVVLRDPVSRALSDYAQAASKRPEIASFEHLAFISKNRSLSTTSMSNYSTAGCQLESFVDDCLVNTSWGGIRIGIYVRHVMHWLRHFRRDQLHFVHGERLVSHPAAEMADVERFLRLRPFINDSHFRVDTSKGFPCIVRPSPLPSTSSSPSPSPHCLGKTKGRTHPRISESARRLLRDFFRPFNERLYDVTGIDFGWP